MNHPPSFTDFASFLDEEVGSIGSPERKLFYYKSFLFRLKSKLRHHPSPVMRIKAWFSLHLPRKGKRTRMVEEGESRFHHKLQSNEWLIGMHGIAISSLRLQGKVKIGEKLYDATSLSGIIHKGQRLRVTGCKFHQLEVVLDDHTSR